MKINAQDQDELKTMPNEARKQRPSEWRIKCLCACCAVRYPTNVM